MIAHSLAALALGLTLGTAQPLAAQPLTAQPLSAAPSEPARAADIVFLGEVHDNPDHHAVQSHWVTDLAPAALVFEMIAPEQAGTITPDLIADPDALAAALHWDASGWPDFAMYHPIFAAAPTARIYGAALPRAQARMVIQDGPATALPPADVTRFGLDSDLPPDQQAARQAHQMAAHCDALPDTMLPGMVTIQRVRDAWLAKQALTAWAETGGPVVVITGNGHARRDWGAPALLARAAPDLRVFALGQSENGQSPDGHFDLTLDAPAPDRPDPCDAFR